MIGPVRDTKNLRARKKVLKEKVQGKGAEKEDEVY